MEIDLTTTSPLLNTLLRVLVLGHGGDGGEVDGGADGPGLAAVDLHHEDVAAVRVQRQRLRTGSACKRMAGARSVISQQMGSSYYAASTRPASGQRNLIPAPVALCETAGQQSTVY